ncbi:MAG TPA: hypothetical protein VH879_11290 [Gemmatimonadales bacterium]|jgi:hypothetical protein
MTRLRSLLQRPPAGPAPALAALSAIVLGATAVALSPAPPRTQPATVDSLTLELRYIGTGAEGVDLVWRGWASEPVGGQVTLRLAYAGPPADREMPIWPTNALLFFSADDSRSSFAAELSGSLNWLTGEMHLSGIVTDGLGSGSAVDQTLQLRRPGYDGRTAIHLLRQVAIRSVAQAMP